MNCRDFSSYLIVVMPTGNSSPFVVCGHLGFGLQVIVRNQTFEIGTGLNIQPSPYYHLQPTFLAHR